MADFMLQNVAYRATVYRTGNRGDRARAGMTFFDVINISDRIFVRGVEGSDVVEEF